MAYQRSSGKVFEKIAKLGIAFLPFKAGNILQDVDTNRMQSSSPLNCSRLRGFSVLQYVCIAKKLIMCYNTYIAMRGGTGVWI